MIVLVCLSLRMNWVVAEMEERVDFLASSPSYLPATTSFTPYSNVHPKDSILSPTPTSSSGNKISPAVLFIIVILAVIFFISGLLHLLVRLLIKQPAAASASQSSRYPDMSGSDALQRQLQQLFHLHDSGLDQAFIDALPVFLYKEIMGLKEPFDCAVCLSEFSENDKLRLLPMCSHAFHLHCIDTWLLSNSTCPLCRGTLLVPGLPFENPAFEYSVSREEDRFSSYVVDELSRIQKPVENEEIVGEKKNFSVRLGKFRSLNDGEQAVEAAVGETSSNLDARRCFSMGSYQYVLDDSNLQVALPQLRDGTNRQHSRRSGINGNFSAELEVEGKKLCKKSRGESLSVSKIWLWSKKGKLSSTSETSNVVSSNTDQVPTWMVRTQDV